MQPFILRLTVGTRRAETAAVSLPPAPGRGENDGNSECGLTIGTKMASQVTLPPRRLPLLFALFLVIFLNFIPDTGFFRMAFCIGWIGMIASWLIWPPVAEGIARNSRGDSRSVTTR